MLNYILLGVGAVASVAGWFLRRKEKAAAASAGRKAKKKYSVLFFVGLWFFIGMLGNLLTVGEEKKSFGVEIWAERFQIGGYSLSETVLVSWILTVIILIVCLLIRFVLIPRMKDVPHGVQNAVEIAVESVSKYTRSTAGALGENLPAYIFSLAFYMVLCSGVELLGFRAPTSDITLTVSMALITFVLINYYGIKKKGFVGRIKSLAPQSEPPKSSKGKGVKAHIKSAFNPSSIVFPFKVISDLAMPVSLACRLFGNMLAGLIVMDLLYTALNTFSFGIPSIFGLYFNLFHPLIQVFIFVTLTLTFINEAVE